MKVWPIITLVGLLYGASVSDSHNVGRESNPHPHRSTLDAEVAADFARRIAQSRWPSARCSPNS